MLFTRCPGCQTTFRIAADTLRVANGAVRCGSCATVFSAYSGLRQDALDEGMRPNDKFLSPTLQTQELAGIEEIASPDLAEAAEDAQPSDEDDGEMIVLETLAEELAHEPDEDIEPAPWDEDDSDMIVLETSAENLTYDAPEDAEPSVGDEDDGEMIVLETLGEDLASAPNEILASERPVEPLPAGAFEFAASARPPHKPDAETEDAAAETSGKLQFDAPVDEWAQLLSEIERSVSADAPVASDAPVERTDGDGATPAATRARGESQGPQFWDVGEPFSLTSWDTGERAGPNQATEQDAVADDSKLAARAAAERDVEPDTELVISAEEIDATLSADPDLLTALEAGLGPLPLSSRTSRFWTVGVATLTLALTMQAVHHYRSSLASQPLIGGVLQTAYGLLGLEILLAWDLEQYQITNWAATAGPGNAGAGNLHITAQIRNSGPKAQPYPNIQLELKDRWEAVIGSRVFLPHEYLGPDLDASRLMTAGATVPADLAVVDPGLDASGFELDVCLETEAGYISCAADRVFQ